MPKPKKKSELAGNVDETRQRDPPERIRKGVTGQQRMFVDAIQADPELSLVEAARMAGYKYPSQAVKNLMAKPVIQAMVSKVKNSIAERMEFNGMIIESQLMEIVLFDPASIFTDETGAIEFKRLEDIPEATRRCINGIKITQKTFESGTITEMEIKWPDKLAAIKLGMLRAGLLEPDKPNETNVSINLGGIRDALSETNNPVIGGDIIEGLVAKRAGEASKSSLPTPKKRKT